MAGSVNFDLGEGYMLLALDCGPIGDALVLRCWIGGVDAAPLEDFLKRVIIDEDVFLLGDATITQTSYTTTWTWPVGAPVFVEGQDYAVSIDTCDGDPFDGYLAWHYLDLGALGYDKELVGFDLIGTGDVDVQFGYDQKNPAYVTDAYTLDADTLTGQMIAMPITAPSIQMRLTFAANQEWEWSSSVLYVQDRGSTG